jgi:hypothetical protein
LVIKQHNMTASRRVLIERTGRASETWLAKLVFGFDNDTCSPWARVRAVESCVARSRGLGDVPNAVGNNHNWRDRGSRRAGGQWSEAD